MNKNDKIFNIYKISKGKFYNGNVLNIFKEKISKKYYLLNYNNNTNKNKYKNDEIGIVCLIYYIKDLKDLKIFGETFLKNNKKKVKIIIKNKEYNIL